MQRLGISAAAALRATSRLPELAVSWPVYRIRTECCPAVALNLQNTHHSDTNTMKKYILASIALVSFSIPILAQEVHSDVEFSYVDGMIHIEPGAEGYVFEGEFGTGPFTTLANEPGIASEPEEGLGVNAGNIIGFNVLGKLQYWDGTQFSSPGDTVITIEGVGGAPDTVIDGASGVQPVSFLTPTNLLGQADASGEVHVDPGFSISSTAATGGYGILLSLSTDDPSGIADSAPFGIFLNFGELDEELFEAGVEAFAAANGLTVVPEPSTGWFLIAAMTLLVIRQRKGL